VLRADRVLDYTGATPQPLVKTGQPTVTDSGGDGDGFLERGETGTLTLPVTNVGDGTATGINVTVTSDDPLVTVTPRARSYGNLRPGASRSHDFTVKLASGYPNGKPFTLAFRVTFAGALSPTSSTFRVPTGHPAAAPTTFAYTGPPVAIPDNDRAHPATVSFTVNLPGYAAAVTFSIDGTACTATAGATTVGIDHTFVSDLVATLTNPSGTTVTLFEHDGGGGNNLCQAVFDDAAADPFSDADGDAAPFTGTWRPDQPLAGLLAAPVTGTWKLTVADTARADTGSIRAVSLHITGYES
jgi:subtilisin-like proprotein convertase family protein